MSITEIKLPSFDSSIFISRDKLEEISQLLQTYYLNITIIFVVFASIPFDPLWLSVIIALCYKLLDNFLKAKPKLSKDIAFGIFYGLVGATPNFFHSSSNSFQKTLFFILFAKYSQSSLAACVALLSNALFVCMAHVGFFVFIRGFLSILAQIWVPFLALIITELPKSLKKQPASVGSSQPEINHELEVKPSEKAQVPQPKLDDLVAENKMLKEKLSSFEDFLATSFHELKNPLNVIVGSLRLMIEQNSIQNQELLSNLKRAFAAGEYLRIMITSTLDWRKNNFRDLEMNFKEADTLAFMGKVWAICGSLIKNKSLQGFLRAAKELPQRIVIDEQRMMQIIINLITNAVKFTSKGYVSIEFQWVPTIMVFRKIDRVTVDKSNSDKPKAAGSMAEKIDEEKIAIHSSGKFKLLTNRVDYFELNNDKESWTSAEKLSVADARGLLKIRITDSGCGMDQSQIDKLFQKFSQVNRDEKVNQMGTGLGLWISKQFIDKMNGTIKASSVPDKGTTFEISIPVKPSSAASSINATNSANSGTSIRLPTSPRSKHLGNAITPISTERDQPGEIPFQVKKVLIVDDDQFNITLLRQWCKKQGYITLEATNGKEAVRVAETSAEEIGVILMDEEMPEMRGSEAISVINAICRAKGMSKIPSYCLSGNSAPRFEQDCIKAGFDDVIQKPIDYTTLNTNLARALRKDTTTPTLFRKTSVARKPSIGIKNFNHLDPQIPKEPSAIQQLHRLGPQLSKFGI